MTIGVHRHDGDFERWLEEELPKTVRANRGPSPRATQAAYHASGWMPSRRGLGKMAWTFAVAVAIAALALGAGGVAAAAYTGSANPVSWGKAVVRVVQGYTVVRSQAPDAAPFSQGEEGAVHAPPGSHPSGPTAKPAPARHEQDPGKAPDRNKDGSSVPTGSDDTGVKGKSRVVPSEVTWPAGRATPAPGKSADVDHHEAGPPTATPATSKRTDGDGHEVRHDRASPVTGKSTDGDGHESGQAGASPITSKSTNAEGTQAGQVGATPVASKSTNAEGTQAGQVGATPVASKSTNAEGTQAGQVGATPVASKSTNAQANATDTDIRAGANNTHRSVPAWPGRG